MAYYLTIHNGEREFFIVKDPSGELYATICANEEERKLKIDGNPVAEIYPLAKKLIDKIHAAVGNQLTEETYTVKLHAVVGYFSTLLATCSCAPSQVTA